LLAALQAMQRQQRRDAVTGLVGLAALEQTQALLPAAQQAVAFVGVEVLAMPPGAAFLRRLSATLRANVRREDLVCRSGPATLVIVLPGVRRGEAAGPAERVRTALAEGCQGYATALGARLAVGVGYWEAGASTVHWPQPH
jgi:GGDEF domain-containing protein